MRMKLWNAIGVMALLFGFASAVSAQDKSWEVDLYDDEGSLVGLQESHPISYYELPMFGSTLETVYDFKSNRYFIDGLDNNEPMYDFNVDIGPRDFSPQALRRDSN